MRLLELLKQPEGKTLEFKRDLSSPDGVLRSIVAFANTAGGTLLIGVEDKSRHVRGVKDPLATEERLANLVSDNIMPRLAPELEILSWRRTHVLAVQVFPSPTRPHYLRAAGLENSAYVRVGSTNRRADSEMIAELRRFARGESFDEQPLAELDSEALDFRVASELFAPIRRLKTHDLETLKLIARHQGRKVPTVGGILLFGKERERYFPDAWIQAGRFQKNDRSRIVDTVEIRAHLPLAVEEAIEFIRKHDTRAAEIGPVRRTERWGLPPLAVREAVINAVVHADYAQRGAPCRTIVEYFYSKVLWNPSARGRALEAAIANRCQFGLASNQLPYAFAERSQTMVETFGSIARRVQLRRNAMNSQEILEKVARGMVATGVYKDVTTAIQALAVEQVDRKITVYRKQVQRFEGKYNQSLEEHSRTLAGKASIAEEEEWMEWKGAAVMLDAWQSALRELISAS